MTTSFNKNKTKYNCLYERELKIKAKDLSYVTTK